MSVFPKKPQAGERVLQGLFDSVNQIIDYLPSLRVSGDNKTIKVSTFKSGTIVEAITKPTSSGGARVTETEAATEEYNGYFAIKTAERTEEDLDNNRVRVFVCDGATWNEETEKSRASYAYINGVGKTFESVELTVTRTEPYIVLRYYFKDNTAKILAVPEPVTSFYTWSDYIIGEFTVEDSEAKIVQRHKSDNGTITFNTYTNLCMVGDIPNE